MPTSQPNILLIVVDQVIRDSLSAYGGPCGTPALENLARSGVQFTGAYTTISLCSPARGSMFTGQLPHRHGVLYNVTDAAYGRAELDENAPMITRFLAPAGYRCGYFGKWHIGLRRGPREHGFEGTSHPGFGLPSGFVAEYDAFLKRQGHAGLRQVSVRDLLTAVNVPSALMPLGRDIPGAAKGALYSGVIDLPTELTPAGYVASETIEFMRRSEGARFFAVAAFWGPHHPALPSPEYAGRHPPASLPEWPNYRDELRTKPRIQARYAQRLQPRLTGLPWGEWQRIIAAHYDFMAMIDSQIGRMLDALTALGLDGNTLVMFTADHGDTLGCHGGQWDKGPYMYEETYAVPLLARAPGGPAGRRTDDLTSNMDVFATALEAAGVEPPPDTDARSFLPAANGSGAGARDCVIGQFYGFDLRGTFLQRMIRMGPHKYVYNPSDTDELYDLRADPAELVNRIDDPQHAETARALKERLLREMRATRDPYAAFADDLMGL
ncbi:MAG: sulfatase-like hydrolase/transferase [Kiritimatiellae bacterium]|nr:sulfatase-like hydrolase/transferase [Kiritimatiellia bacterium]